MTERAIETATDAGGPPSELLMEMATDVTTQAVEPPEAPEVRAEEAEALDGGSPPDWLLMETNAEPGEGDGAEPVKPEQQAEALAAGPAPDWIEEIDTGTEGSDTLSTPRGNSYT